MNRVVLQPWSDHGGWAVLSDLDLDDALEAALYRGDDADPLALFADWRAANAWRASSLVATGRGGRPFAILGVMATGMKGVAQAALLSRSRARHGRELAELAVQLRAGLPAFAGERGLTRIEARAWAGHPTASRLLAALGFTHEADLKGFAGGPIVFRQFAWIAPPAPLEERT